MRRLLIRILAVPFLVTLTVGLAAGVGEAKTVRLATPTMRTALSSPSISVGATATDTATLTGKRKIGAPTGTVTFFICGPTANPAPCASPNIGAGTVGLSTGAAQQSTAGVTIEPDAPGWYCFLDEYGGDAKYKPVSDNASASECLDVTTGSTGQTTPTIKSVLSPSTIAFGATANDTATVTGGSAAGPPTGTLTFFACGPTAQAAACTSPNIGPATAEMSPESGNRSTATVTINPGAPGWYCFLDQYNGDSHYTSVSDNDPASECLDVTTGSTGQTTPTIKSVLSPSTIAFGATANDTATVTGGSAAGPPTGTLTFFACGPTAQAAACTSPNIGPATAEMSPESGNRSTATVTINPGAPGWYCFLDQYNGDSHYTSVSDNDPASECLDVTGTMSASGTVLTPRP